MSDDREMLLVGWWAIEKIIDAIYFAAVKHRFQRRKDNDKTPYINHPLHVAHLLRSAGVQDCGVLVSAILHDTVEDTDTTYEEIEEKFGERIADIVKEVTDDKSLPKNERKKLQIEHAKTASNAAKLVKMADKYSNLSDIKNNPPSFWSREELDGYIFWSYAVFRNISGVNRNMEEKMENLFRELGIDENISDEQLKERLESYYRIIDNSE